MGGYVDYRRKERISLEGKERNLLRTMLRFVRWQNDTLRIK